MIYEKQLDKNAKWYSEEGIKFYLRGKDLNVDYKDKNLFMRKGFNIKGGDGNVISGIKSLQDAIYKILSFPKIKA